MATKTDKATLNAVDTKEKNPKAGVQPFNKFGKTKDVEVEEDDGSTTIYKLQFPGTKAAMETIDRGKQGESQTDYFQGLMDNVIVSPHVSYKYWDEHKGFQTVLSAADSFLTELL